MTTMMVMTARRTLSTLSGESEAPKDALLLQSAYHMMTLCFVLQSGDGGANVLADVADSNGILLMQATGVYETSPLISDLRRHLLPHLIGSEY